MAKDIVHWLILVDFADTLDMFSNLLRIVAKKWIMFHFLVLFHLLLVFLFYGWKKRCFQFPFLFSDHSIIQSFLDWSLFCGAISFMEILRHLFSYFEKICTSYVSTYIQLPSFENSGKLTTTNNNQLCGIAILSSKLHGFCYHIMSSGRSLFAANAIVTNSWSN